MVVAVVVVVVMVEMVVMDAAVIIIVTMVAVIFLSLNITSINKYSHSLSYSQRGTRGGPETSSRILLE